MRNTDIAVNDNVPTGAGEKTAGASGSGQRAKKAAPYSDNLLAMHLDVHS